jgi:hypothetical protein
MTTRVIQWATGPIGWLQPREITTPPDTLEVPAWAH